MTCAGRLVCAARRVWKWRSVGGKDGVLGRIRSRRQRSGLQLESLGGCFNDEIRCAQGLAIHCVRDSGQCRRDFGIGEFASGASRLGCADPQERVDEAFLFTSHSRRGNRSGQRRGRFRNPWSPAHHSNGADLRGYLAFATPSRTECSRPDAPDALAAWRVCRSRSKAQRIGKREPEDCARFKCGLWMVDEQMGCDCACSNCPAGDCANRAGKNPAGHCAGCNYAVYSIASRLMPRCGKDGSLIPRRVLEPGVPVTMACSM